MIRYSDAFSDLNPLEEALPLQEFHDGHYIAQEAKAALPDGFTIVDLNAGLEILMQLRLKDGGDITKGRPESTGLYYTAPLSHFVSAEEVELPERPSGEPFLWSQVFAVAALASVADLVTFSRRPGVYDPNLGEFEQIMKSSEERLVQSHLEQLPMEAMESLGFCRLFLERERFELDAAKREQKRGQGVSKTKLKNYHEVKLAIVNRFNELRKEDSGLSVRKMARIILGDLDEQLKRMMTSEDPQQQVENWLGQYKKGTLPGQDRLPPYEA
ncbi:hypothetical protein EDC38_0397 [Marinimicrobium koreense]|uniref:Uncharacterized protein n=1 Tax=Marinimicrobium koreense TaxID=306545 RepID=A0A3N1NVB2_9GAMM|nr:hypothetical protein [Marinimicrobium koreense]ROQ19809.1 hypothetical protein EDC38_0397 [Marinimicrobium koreense]